MEFGVHLPLISFMGEQRSLDDLLALTRAANDLGYTHLCANDHLVFSRPWLDGPTALAAVLAPLLDRPVEPLRSILPIGSAEACAR